MWYASWDYNPSRKAEPIYKKIQMA
jgi:hypothetical protein